MLPTVPLEPGIVCFKQSHYTTVSAKVHSKIYLNVTNDDFLTNAPDRHSPTARVATNRRVAS